MHDIPQQLCHLTALQRDRLLLALCLKLEQKLMKNEKPFMALCFTPTGEPNSFSETGIAGTDIDPFKAGSVIKHGGSLPALVKAVAWVYPN